MVLHETFLLCVPAIVTAVAGGMALSWILIALVNPLSFGWSYPISSQWQSLVYPAFVATVAFTLVAMTVAVFERRWREFESSHE